MEEKEIVVSITSLAYNQEKYIRQTLEGFVSQKTDFPFEILIHDDASTDGTTDIIREYAQKYPDIMRPMYETENQYSKGVKVGVELRNRARGKYIAFCEGDDYWTDPEKLQKQVDYMEAHPECSLCVHAARTADAEGKLLQGVMRAADHDCDFDANDVILSGGGMFQTQTMLARREFMGTYPDFYYQSPVGDYPLQIYLGMCGKIHYMDQFMSVYRVQSDGSWSVNVLTSTEKTVNFCKKISTMLSEVAKYDGGKYAKACQERILLNEIYIALMSGDKKTVKKLRGSVDHSRLNLAMKVGIYLPGLYCRIREARTRRNASQKQRT